MTIDEQAVVAHAISTSHGFWDGDVTVDFILSKIALLHGECSEVMEEVRADSPEEKILEECADVYIRLIDLVQGMRNGGFLSSTISFDAMIDKKMAINAARPWKHGKLA